MGINSDLPISAVWRHQVLDEGSMSIADAVAGAEEPAEKFRFVAVVADIGVESADRS
jgi:hypothetical protein